MVNQFPTKWSIKDGKLHRQFTFKNFRDAFAFMTQVADLAEQYNHHPDWSNSYNTVDISLFSHEQQELTEKDIQLAAAINDCSLLSTLKNE